MDRGNEINRMIGESKQIGWSKSTRDHLEGINSLSIDKTSNSKIATASFDHTINIYDINLTLNQTLKGHTKGVWTCTFKQNETNSLISGSNDTSILIWDLKQGASVQKITQHTEAIYDIKSINDTIVSCSKGMICVWDFRQPSKPITVIKNSDQGFVYSVNLFSSTHVISGLMDGSLLLYDIETGLEKVRHQVKDNISRKEYNMDSGNSIYSINLLKSDKNKFLTSHSDGSVRLWKYENDLISEEKGYQFHFDPVTCISTTNDDSKCASASKDHSTILWQLGNDNKIDFSLVGHTDVVSACDFLNQDTVITSSWDASLNLWKLKN